MTKSVIDNVVAEVIKARQRKSAQTKIKKTLKDTVAGIRKDNLRNAPGQRFYEASKGTLKQQGAGYLAFLPSVHRNKGLDRRGKMVPMAGMHGSNDRRTGNQKHKARRELSIYRSFDRAVRKTRQKEADRYISIADRLNKSGAKDIERAKKGLGKAGKFGIDLSSGIVGFAADAAIGAVTGTGMLAPMGARATGSGYLEARNAGANHNQALRYGLGSGMIEAASEGLFSVAKPLKKLTKTKGIFNLDKVIGKATASYVKSNAGRNLVHGLKYLGVSGGTEGAEEIVAGIANTYLKRAIYDPSAKIDHKELLKEGSIGAIIGAGFGGASLGSNIAAGRDLKHGKSIDKLLEDALSLPETSDAYRLGYKAKKRLDNMQNLSDAEIGMLASKVNDTVSSYRDTYNSIRERDLGLASAKRGRAVKSSGDIGTTHLFDLIRKEQDPDAEVSPSSARYHEVYYKVKDSLTAAQVKRDVKESADAYARYAVGEAEADDLRNIIKTEREVPGTFQKVFNYALHEETNEGALRHLEASNLTQAKYYDDSDYEANAIASENKAVKETRRLIHKDYQNIYDAVVGKADDTRSASSVSGAFYDSYSAGLSGLGLEAIDPRVSSILKLPEKLAAYNAGLKVRESNGKDYIAKIDETLGIKVIESTSLQAEDTAVWVQGRLIAAPDSKHLFKDASVQYIIQTLQDGETGLLEDFTNLVRENYSLLDKDAYTEDIAGKLDDYEYMGMTEADAERNLLADVMNLMLTDEEVVLDLLRADTDLTESMLITMAEYIYDVAREASELKPVFRGDFTVLKKAVAMWEDASTAVAKVTEEAYNEETKEDIEDERYTDDEGKNSSDRSNEWRGDGARRYRNSGRDGVLQTVRDGHDRNSQERGQVGEVDKSRTGDVLSIDEISDILKRHGVEPSVLVPLKEEEYPSFSAVLDENIKSRPDTGNAVDSKSPEELVNAGCKCLMPEDKSGTIAVTKEGDIEALSTHAVKGKKYKSSEQNKLPQGKTLFLHSASHGGKKGDCFGIQLMGMYAQMGAIPVCRLEFSPEYFSEEQRQAFRNIARKLNLKTEYPDVYVFMLNGDDFETRVSKSVNGEYKTPTQAELDSLPLFMDYEDALSARDKVLAMYEAGDLTEADIVTTIADIARVDNKRRKIIAKESPKQRALREKREAVAKERAKNLAKLKEEKAKAEAKLLKHKEKSDAEVQSIKEKLKEVKEANKKKREALESKHKEKEAKRKERGRKSKGKKDLYKKYKSLSDILTKPQEGKFIPKEFRNAVADLLRIIDWETDVTRKNEAKKGRPSKRIEALRRLKNYYANVNDHSFIIKNEDLEDKLDSLYDLLVVGETAKSIDELNSEELSLANDIFAGVLHQIRTANKTFVGDKATYVSDLGKATIREFSKYTSKKMFDWHIVNFFRNENTRPKDFFDLLGSDTFNSLYKNLRAGFDQHIDNTTVAKDFFSGIADLFGRSTVDKWSDKASVSVSLSTGVTVNITPAQLMTLYLHTKREQSRKHLLGSGFVLEQKSLGNKKRSSLYRLTETDFKRIEEALSSDMKLVADKISSFLNSTVSDWGNETSEKLYGYELYTDPNYIPIESDSNFLNEGFDQAGESKLANLGFTKKTQRVANNPMVVSGLFEVATKHTVNMSMYNALTPAIKDFERVYNFKLRDEDGNIIGGTKNSIIKARGRYADEYIVKFIKDANNSYITEEKHPIVNKLLTNFKKAAIAANTRVLLQQPTSIIRALLYMSPKYLAKGMAITPMQAKVLKKEMRENVPIARWKGWGFVDVDVSRNFRDIMFDEDTLYNKATMGIYGWADDVAWTRIYAAVKAETKELYPELKEGTENYVKHVNARMSEIIDGTQVVDSIFHRAQIMRHKSTFNKVFTTFAAEPTSTYSMARAALLKNYKNPRRIMRIGVVLAANTALIAVAQSIPDYLRNAYTGDDDDKDKRGWDKFWVYYLNNVEGNIMPITGLPFVREVWNMFDGYDVTPSYLSSIEDLIKASKSIFEGDGYGTKAQNIRKMLEAIGGLTGVPFKNVAREFEALGRGAFMLMDSEEYYNFTLDKHFRRYEKNKSLFQNYLKHAIEEEDPDFKHEVYEFILKHEEGEDAEILAQSLIKRIYGADLREAIRTGDIDEIVRIRDIEVANGIEASQVDGYISRNASKAMTPRFAEALADGQQSRITDAVATMKALGISQKDVCYALIDGYKEGYKKGFAGKNRQTFVAGLNTKLVKAGMDRRYLRVLEKAAAKGYAKFLCYRELKKGNVKAADRISARYFSQYPGLYKNANGAVYGVKRSGEKMVNLWDSGDWDLSLWADDFDGLEKSAKTSWSNPFKPARSSRGFAGHRRSGRGRRGRRSGGKGRKARKIAMSKFRSVSGLYSKPYHSRGAFNSSPYHSSSNLGFKKATVKTVHTKTIGGVKNSVATTSSAKATGSVKHRVASKRAANVAKIARSNAKSFAPKVIKAQNGEANTKVSRTTADKTKEKVISSLMKIADQGDKKKLVATARYYLKKYPELFSELEDLLGYVR